MIRVVRFQIVEAKFNPEKFKTKLAEQIKKIGEEKFLERTKKYADITSKALNLDLEQDQEWGCPR